ncbi:MAG TPA: hypothetical protein VGI81_05140 [Tepidisphaeraceae bacterium]|jgi:hypothetical protein
MIGEIVLGKWALFGIVAGSGSVLYFFALCFFLIGRAKDVFIVIRVMGFLVAAFLTFWGTLCWGLGVFVVITR